VCDSGSCVGDCNDGGKWATWQQTAVVGGKKGGTKEKRRNQATANHHCGASTAIQAMAGNWQLATVDRHEKLSNFK